MNSEGSDRKVLCDIARCAFEVINGLLERDRLLARRLRSRETGSHQIYREESITVEMAATLLERFSDRVEITLFTPQEERCIGADWYWRFERDDGAIHARVQAKRVQRSKFDQADNEGHIDINIKQLEQLLQETQRLRAEEGTERLPGLQAWLATYARFDATPPCRKDDLTSCSLHQHPEVCANHGPSLWVANAEEIIQQIGRQQASVRQIIQNSLRLDCLLPCIYGTKVDYGPVAKGFTLQTGLPTYQQCLTIIENSYLSEFEGALLITV